MGGTCCLPFFMAAPAARCSAPKGEFECVRITTACVFEDYKVEDVGSGSHRQRLGNGEASSSCLIRHSPSLLRLGSPRLPTYQGSLWVCPTCSDSLVLSPALCLFSCTPNEKQRSRVRRRRRRRRCHRPELRHWRHNVHYHQGQVSELCGSFPSPLCPIPSTPTRLGTSTCSKIRSKVLIHRAASCSDASWCKIW